MTDTRKPRRPATSVVVHLPDTGISTSLSAAAYEFMSQTHTKPNSKNNVPARALPLDLPPFNLLRTQHLKPRTELLCLLPITPHAPQRLWPTAVARRAPPAQTQPRLVLDQPEPAAVARLVRRAGRVRVCADDAPLDRVALVLDELLVHRVCDERDGFAGEPEVCAERRGECLGCER